MPFFFFFFFNDPATTEIYTLSLHDALPIFIGWILLPFVGLGTLIAAVLCLVKANRSEEHTSELQSLRHLVCRLLLEKKKKDQRQESTPVHGRSDDRDTRSVSPALEGARRGH